MEEKVNPSRRAQEEDKSKKDLVKHLEEQLAKERDNKYLWKNRALKMETKRNEWKMISFLFALGCIALLLSLLLR